MSDALLGYQEWERTKLRSTSLNGHSKLIKVVRKFQDDQIALMFTVFELRCTREQRSVIRKSFRGSYCLNRSEYSVFRMPIKGLKFCTHELEAFIPVGDFYIKLFDTILADSVGHGHNGYYFPENGEYSMYDVNKEIQRIFVESVIVISSDLESRPITNEIAAYLGGPDISVSLDLNLSSIR